MADNKSTSVEYIPAPGDSPVTTAFGEEFRAGKPVQIDDERILGKLRGHPNFSVDGKKKRGPGRPRKEEDLPKDTPARSAGAQAAREGKTRQAPGELKDEAAMDWLSGYDAEKLSASQGVVGRSAISLGQPAVTDPDAVHRAQEQKAAIEAANRARAAKSDPNHPQGSHGDDD